MRTEQWRWRGDWALVASQLSVAAFAMAGDPARNLSRLMAAWIAALDDVAEAQKRARANRSRRERRFRGATASTPADPSGGKR